MKHKDRSEEAKRHFPHLHDIFYRTHAANPWGHTGYVADVPLTEEEAESYEDVMGVPCTPSNIKKKKRSERETSR